MEPMADEWPSSQPGGAAAAGKASIRILLVEGGCEDAELVGRLLGQCAEPRFEITRAPTFAAALPIAQRGDHAAVLLDLSVPDSVDFAHLRELALSVPHTAIVILTGLDRQSVAVQAIRHGAQDYLVKGNATSGDLARSIQMAIERKSFEAQLAERANFDSLTGLVSRTLFQDRLAHAVARARRTDERAGLLFIDLDGFKAVNDALGHAAGDEVLRLVAARFRVAVRESDTLARFGGDEFTILIEPLAGAAAAARVAERVLAALRGPLAVAEQEVCVTPSIGVAMFPDHAGEADALLRAADAAMYRAKKSGKNNVQFC